MAANREFWEIARQVADRAQLGGAAKGMIGRHISYKELTHA